ncbi:MAG: thioredoxin-dependent thiol peroxidase [Candidatus Pacebacteria bacterium]|nr:thioredoxin-dependent thiol peroxidase [Candidatus Paceibacterota bacterium]
MNLLKENTKAPDFELMDQEGKAHKLSDYKGKWVLLYFYPKDDTAGCTKEACMIRDSWAEFKNKNAVVLGVSVDSVESHDKFHKKYKLPFTILADEEKKVVNQYGVWGENKFMGRVYQGTNRVSYLINPYQKIVKVYEKVKPEIHAEEVLKDLEVRLKK